MPPVVAVVSLRTRQDELREELVRWDDNAMIVGWTPVSIAAAKAHAGPMRLQLDAITDNARQTSFFLDTLSLTATVCR